MFWKVGQTLNVFICYYYDDNFFYYQIINHLNIALNNNLM
jgi:TnpA family transposase